MPKKIDLPSDEKAKLLLDAVEDRKAVDPHLMDLRGNTVMFDFMLVCSGTSDVHIRAIADSAVEKAEQARLPSPKTAGEAVGEWVLLDFGDVIVHVMSDEARSRYRLEQFWSTPQPKGALPPTPDSVGANGAAAGEVYAGAQPNVFSIVPAEGGEDEEGLEDEDIDAVEIDDEDWDDAAFFEDADTEVEPIAEEDFDADFEQEPSPNDAPRRNA